MPHRVHPKPRRTPAAPVLTALTLVGTLAAGCGSADNPAGTPTGGTVASAGQVTATPAAPTGSATGSPAAPPADPVPESLRFTGRTVDGKPFDAATLAGKPTALWFWAAWCTRCRAAAGTVAEVQRANADRVNLIGVAGLNSGEAAMRRFVQENGIAGFPSVADDDGAVWRKFSVTTQEYYVLLDSSGKVVHSGPLSGADLRRRVAALS